MIAVIAVGVGVVAFDGSNAMAASASTIAVTPTTGLSDGQSVAVTGSGSPGGALIDTIECEVPVGTSTVSCDTADVTVTTSDASGAFSTTLTVRAQFDGVDASTGQPTKKVDCTIAPGCIVLSTTVDANSPAHSNPVAISFSG
ncbi:enediyne antibiotic chromoprotein [Kibdelosporangium lantanae]|uniref:Enediyne antibiotic chromoprotein n=1 Tax=Kibdelosporangium lantanae TaxID=1497396 RepID=A0ABW3M1B7_9PSEU